MEQTRRRPGRPKDETKTQAILQAASGLFLDQGLQSTSMDAIAATAGVSKQTLYTHFRNKDDLFRSVIRTKLVEHQIQEPPAGADDEVGIRASLERLGTELLSLVTDPQVVAMFRVVIGEAHAYPKIAELFYDAGPNQAVSVIAAQLERHMARGRLRRGDPRTAASELTNLCKGELHMQLLLGLPAPGLEARIRAQVEAAVRSFLAAWGTGTG